MEMNTRDEEQAHKTPFQLSVEGATGLFVCYAAIGYPPLAGYASSVETKIVGHRKAQMSQRQEVRIHKLVGHVRLVMHDAVWVMVVVRCRRSCLLQTAARGKEENTCADEAYLLMPSESIKVVCKSLLMPSMV